MNASLSEISLRGIRTQEPIGSAPRAESSQQRAELTSDTISRLAEKPGPASLGGSPQGMSPTRSSPSIASTRSARTHETVNALQSLLHSLHDNDCKLNAEVKELDRDTKARLQKLDQSVTVLGSVSQLSINQLQECLESARYAAATHEAHSALVMQLTRQNELQSRQIDTLTSQVASLQRDLHTVNQRVLLQTSSSRQLEAKAEHLIRLWQGQ